MTNADLLIILETYAISFGLQLLGWPWVRKIFRKLPDEGWCLSRLLVTIVTAIVIWELGFFGLPSNTTQGVMAFLALILLADVWLMIKEGVGVMGLPKQVSKLASVEEYLFLVGFGAMAMIRGYAPNIDNLEKFMDFGFVNQYLSSATLPANDMWQAGQTINYYSFGHFWTSILTKIWGVNPATGFNLMLAFIFGTAIELVFMACFLLVGRRNSRAGLVGGVMGAMSVLVAGNSQVIWYMIKNHTLQGYWYADATRFIYHTIHEFPSYSFVVSDLHGHVLDLPIVLAFLVILLVWLNDRKRIQEVLLGVLFGVMMMTNTWDVAVYGLLMMVVGVQLIFKDPTEIKSLIRAAAIIFLAMAVTAGPWWLSFKVISDGVGIATERSPLWQLAALWAGGLLISLQTVITEGRRGENRLPIRALAITAVLLIAIPEFVFARDIYTTYPRANTMFKLTYQAFIMMGILAGALWGKVMDREVKMHLVWRFVTFFAAFWIFTGTMVFPFASYSSFYNNFSKYQGLDGEKWLESKMSENYEMIIYLRSNKDGRNLVEAVGDSYTLQNSVSVFSGVPSIEGWRVHEWLWRGSYSPVADRENDVREIYQGEDLDTTKAILKKYNIGWILIGQDEKIAYKVNEEKLWQTGEVVWRAGDTYLLKAD